MVHKQISQTQQKLQPLSLYLWRAARREHERHEEAVNRELLHRQHAN